MTVCCDLVKEFPDIIPLQTWGSLSKQGDRDKWKINDCNDAVGGSSKASCQGTIKGKNKPFSANYAMLLKRIHYSLFICFPETF